MKTSSPVIAYPTDTLPKTDLERYQGMREHFYSRKTRALRGTYVSTGDRLWSCFPFLRPLATISDDSSQNPEWRDDSPP